jgi:hypothetical protein
LHTATRGKLSLDTSVQSSLILNRTMKIQVSSEGKRLLAVASVYTDQHAIVHHPPES